MGGGVWKTTSEAVELTERFSGKGKRTALTGAKRSSVSSPKSDLVSLVKRRNTAQTEKKKSVKGRAN
jgi:hypothetical protein